MRDGISAAPINTALRYAAPINTAALVSGTSPALLYAIACNESILGEYAGKWDAATVESGDGGHGLFQLTSSWPDDWTDPAANALYAAQHFVASAWSFWSQQYSLVGADLVRAIAAEFNAGRGSVADDTGALGGHANHGDVGFHTTDHYDRRAEEIYEQLVRDTFSPPGDGAAAGSGVVPTQDPGSQGVAPTWAQRLGLAKAQD